MVKISQIYSDVMTPSVDVSVVPKVFLLKLAGLVVIGLISIDLPLAFAMKVTKGQVIFENIDDYLLCQSKDFSGDWCQEALQRWVKAHPTDAFKAGKLTRQKMSHWAAIPFFSMAFDQRNAQCADEDVQLSVVSAINLPGASNKQIIEKARKIGFELCFPQMKEALVEIAKIDSYAFDNICKDLAAKDLLTGLKRKKCTEQK